MTPVRQRLPIDWISRRTGERLRIGYVSGDFRDHATAHLARKLFQIHDRSRFEIIGYSLRPGDGSRYRRDISAACDRFVELSGLSNAAAAARIAVDGIHILVDMHGYTRFARPEIFALRLPAPVQVAFLGYPGTLGADYIAYIIADRVVLPEELQPCFSEQPVYLPDCYQINDDEQPIAATGLTRQRLACRKIHLCTAASIPLTRSSRRCSRYGCGFWRQAPESVLWLLADTPRCADHLRAGGARAGGGAGTADFRAAPAQAGASGATPPGRPVSGYFYRERPHHGQRCAVGGVAGADLTGNSFSLRVCASLLCALGFRKIDRRG
ncbi:MAG: hypothetical protein MZW92_09300 [Comamonadaceae bacterium]|nr:hypothetical protein [Comamonadaceae bacterium]